MNQDFDNPNKSALLNSSGKKSKKKKTSKYGYILLDDEDDELIVDTKEPLSFTSKHIVEQNKAARKLSDSTASGPLLDLAKPRTFKGPEVTVQSEIVADLETQIGLRITEALRSENIDVNDAEARAAKEGGYAGARFIGAIELTKKPGKDIDKLINEAVLIDLPVRNIDSTNGHALRGEENLFDLVKKAGIENKIIRNTLKTMKSAGQLDYLDDNNIVTDEWKIIIEVHYYRDRDKNMTGLHKDTLGQTLFVNLNFENDGKIPGPEYIVNPATTDKYEDYIGKRLPQSVMTHLKEAKQLLPDPEKFGASEIPDHGVVAFVDELIHHKTPMVGHRASNIPSKVIFEKYPDINKAFESFKAYKPGRFTLSSKKFADFLPKEYKNTASEWLAIFNKAQDSKAVFHLDEFDKVIDRNELETWFDEIWYKDFGAGRVPVFHAGSVTSNVPESRMSVTESGRPPLRREMSEKLLSANPPVQLPAGARRTFFRTWVRVVPTLNNARHAIAASEIAQEFPKIVSAYRNYVYSRRINPGGKFADYLEEKYQSYADQLLDIMQNSTGDKRYYINALPIVIRDHFKSKRLL